jgi:extracellular elastinolytic metalloproteinase
MNKLSATLLGLIFAFTAWSQSVPAPATDALVQAAKASGLSEEDISGYIITDNYTDRWGTQFYYLTQAIDGIPVHNAIMNLVIPKEGKPRVTGNRFVAEAKQRITSTSPAISPEEAIRSYSPTQLQSRSKVPVELVSMKDERRMIYRSPELSNSDIPVELKYVLGQDNLLHLCWDFPIDELKSDDYWSVRVDAHSGEIIDKNNWTNLCNFGPVHNHDKDCNRNFGFKLETAPSSVADTIPNSYRVFAWPAESPIHGPYVLVTDPADLEYSPYGWHDTKGGEEPEFTITRGNNTHAYQDTMNAGQSSNDEPDGGKQLFFDFPFDFNSDAESQMDAAVVNLFYCVNMVHDFAYQYGFDEVSGNFQTYNFGKGGQEEDHVLSEAQDGSGRNNANFSTPPDGGNGRMQMYLWNNNGGELLQILEPSEAAGGVESREGSGWGSVLDSVITEGDLVLVNDGHPENPTYGCGEILNANELNGNIAIIDRGGCEFITKAYNAYQAGAIAAIVCNFDDAIIAMGVGTSGSPLVDMPTIMIKSSDCQRLKLFMSQGPVQAKIERSQVTGPELFDASFDNGVIAHEYGHGISNRLTGGPAAAGCLSNDEQMGEGWSDYFSLVTTVQPGETGAEPRGIGNFVTSGGIQSRGIRRVPYSTDMSICPLTFDDIKGTTAPHPLGEVWAAVLWDLYWNLVDEYGYDADIRNVDAGNNIAIKLVMDGMRYQACRPGFIDGRDAILYADTINNGAANSCIIWNTFARRGLGYSADQGSSENRNDGVEGFDTAPICVNDIVATKSLVDDLLNPAEETTVTVRVSNFRPEMSNNIVVTEIIPEGLSYVDASASHGGQFDNGVITWELGSMESLEEVVLSYDVYTDAGIQSQKYWYDDVEDFDKAYETWFQLNFEGSNIWDLTDFYAHSGSQAWYVPNTANDNDQVHFLAEPVKVVGDKPVFRFYHWYSTTNNRDAGLVQIRREGSQAWEDVSHHFVRNGYDGDLHYDAFTIPFLSGYYGNSGGFIGSYIDLSSYQDEEIYVRFRWGTDGSGMPDTDPFGWVVDDIEFMDMVSYNYPVVVSFDEGEDVVAEFANGGLIINSGDLVLGQKTQLPNGAATLFPNPAGDFVTLQLDGDYSSEQFEIMLFDISGRAVWRGAWVPGVDFVSIPLTGLSTGFYTVMLSSAQQSISLKLIHK